jgi:hypothetical protein
MLFEEGNCPWKSADYTDRNARGFQPGMALHLAIGQPPFVGFEFKAHGATIKHDQQIGRARHNALPDKDRGFNSRPDAPVGNRHHETFWLQNETKRF